MPELEIVRRKFVRLLRAEPPFQVAAGAGGAGAQVLDRWVAARFSPEEVAALGALARERGGLALAQFFAQALADAGVVAPRRTLAS